MTIKPLELFYSYAREDEALRDKLNEHLAILKRQGLIREWYDRNINAGNEWEQKINAHLKSADIILLLISSSFIASDYCYSVEMEEALRRHEAGKARVIPIILRTCDWQSARFGKLQALPRDARPVTRWRDRDAAFTDIAQRIRKAIAEMNGTGYDTGESQPRRPGKTRKGARTGVEEGITAAVSQVTNAPTALNTTLKRAIDKYY
jgi:hypothetical protein